MSKENLKSGDVVVLKSNKEGPKMTVGSLYKSQDPLVETKALCVWFSHINASNVSDYTFLESQLCKADEDKVV